MYVFDLATSVTVPSTITQLLLVMNDWMKALDGGYSVNVLYFDFQKAFDSALHNHLISKLQGCLISGHVFEWIRNFLEGKKQRVVLNSQKSEWLDIISGVPQGSVLGPILFNICKSDIPSIVNTELHLQFADDAGHLMILSSIHINSLAEWANKWQLKFNVSKCNWLHLG